METHGRASSLASHGRRPSRSPAPLVTRRVRASSMARWMVVLPASFGPRTTVTPEARSMSSSRKRRKSRTCSRRILTATPRGRPAAGDRGAGRRAARRPRPTPVRLASSSAMRASRSRMNAPAMVSWGGMAPSVRAGMEASRTRTLRKDGASAVSISSMSTSRSSGRTPVRRTSRTRSGSASLDRVWRSAGWEATPAASMTCLSKRVRPTTRSLTVTLRPPVVSSSSTTRALPARSWSRATGSGAPA